MCEVLVVATGFYWVKLTPDWRWEPIEFDGVCWLAGNGTGYDLYLIGPRIPEPFH